jgi:hypothetical protein
MTAAANATTNFIRFGLYCTIAALGMPIAAKIAALLHTDSFPLKVAVVWAWTAAVAWYFEWAAKNWRA